GGDTRRCSSRVRPLFAAKDRHSRHPGERARLGPVCRLQPIRVRARRRHLPEGENQDRERDTDTVQIGVSRLAPLLSFSYRCRMLLPDVSIQGHVIFPGDTLIMSGTLRRVWSSGTALVVAGFALPALAQVKAFDLPAQSAVNS